MKKSLLVIAGFLFLAACAPAERTVISSRFIEGERLTMERPSPLRLNRVEPRVVTGDTMLNDLVENNVIGREEANRLQTTRRENLNRIPVLVGFTVEDFVLLLNNFLELERYISQQNQVILFYENVAKGENNSPQN